MRAFAQSIVETVRHPLLVLDAGLRVEGANHVFYQVFRVRPQETEGRPLEDETAFGGGPDLLEGGAGHDREL